MVTDQDIIDFLTWAKALPKGPRIVILTSEEVSDMKDNYYGR